MNALLITFLSISIYYLGEIYNTQLRIKTSYRKAFIVHSFIYKRNFNLYKIKNIKLTRFLVSTILEYNVYLVIISIIKEHHDKNNNGLSSYKDIECLLKDEFIIDIYNNSAINVLVHK